MALADMVEAGTVDRLRRVLALTPSGAVRLVDRLAAAGLVERRAGPDGRSLSLVLTAAGRDAAQAVRDARAGAVGSLLAGLGEPERRALLPLVDLLVSTLVDQRLDERAAGTDPAGGWLCRLCDLAACGRRTGGCPADRGGAQR